MDIGVFGSGHIGSTLARHLAALGAVIVDAGNYYPSRDSRIPEIERGLPESVWVAQFPGRPVIKAFNNILAASLATRGVPAGTPGRICLSVAGDDASAKANAAQIAAYRAQADEAARAYVAVDVNNGHPRRPT
jgi:predicted dinucleotide-binding enzyme